MAGYRKRRPFLMPQNKEGMDRSGGRNYSAFHRQEGAIMAGHNAKKEKAGTVAVTFTVAECGEFHSLGEYHEGIGTLEEAVSIYRNIPPGRMNGVPSIGIRLHKAGEPESGDLVLGLVSGRAVNTGLIRYVPEAERNPMVWEAVRELIKMFPEKEVFG